MTDEYGLPAGGVGETPGWNCSPCGPGMPAFKKFKEDLTATGRGWGVSYGPAASEVYSYPIPSHRRSDAGTVAACSKRLSFESHEPEEGRMAAYYTALDGGPDDPFLDPEIEALAERGGYLEMSCSGSDCSMDPERSSARFKSTRKRAGKL